MLKLSVKPGEYLLIGEEIKLVFAGGSANNLRILVDAPRSMSVARSSSLEKHGLLPEQGNRVEYRKERNISPEAQEKIKAILMEERRKAKAAERKQKIS